MRRGADREGYPRAKQVYAARLVELLSVDGVGARTADSVGYVAPRRHGWGSTQADTKDADLAVVAAPARQARQFGSINLTDSMPASLNVCCSEVRSALSTTISSSGRSSRASSILTCAGDAAATSLISVS